MKAILIDPFEQTVKEVQYSGDFHQIYDLIEAETFDVARISRGDGIFVDDEGLLRRMQLASPSVDLQGVALHQLEGSDGAVRRVLPSKPGSAAELKKA